MRINGPWVLAGFWLISSVVWAQAPEGAQTAEPPKGSGHREVPGGPLAEPGPTGVVAKVRAEVIRDGFVSIQVNVDDDGFNIPGDAANEPSIAVDPTAPNRIAIGWRQFDRVQSSFREAGWALSHDGGRTWTFPGVLENGVFRSDPVLAADSNGRFYYYSLYLLGNTILCDLSLSDDGGRTWGEPRAAYGGDKAWTTIDNSGGIGHGNFYASWSVEEGGCCGRRVFTRSTDGGVSFMDPIELNPSPTWGTLAVGPDGELYIGGNYQLQRYDEFVVARSDNAQDPSAAPTFSYALVDLGGEQLIGGSPNPVGLLGQVWVATDVSSGPTRGNVYLLCSVDPPGSDPYDVHFVRSEDGGQTWSEAIAVNTDDRNAWQWFGTMSVAANGRIDVVWIESVSRADYRNGELYYAFSADAGYTWSDRVPASPSFDSHLGWPRQNKLGDYYHMVSDDVGAHLAYAATFNGEQDVYYLRLGDYDCNDNGVGDSIDLAGRAAQDCDLNGIPDSCEIAAGTLFDSNENGTPDACEGPPRRPSGRL